MNEINSVSDIDKVVVDSKEVDSEDDRIFKSMRLRFFLSKKIMSLFLKIPRVYPEQPLTFQHGNL